MLATHDVINNRYELLDTLGQGGMGMVFLADDKEQAEQVAIKVLTLPPGESQLRFRREFRVMSRLKHPHVISIIESGVYRELPYLVMSHLSGGTLLEHYTDGASPEDIVHRLSLMAQIADALAYIHAQGIIHRDLKPENVMLENGEAKLMDFGLAKIQEATVALTNVGAVLGTAHYMSPEQARGMEVDARSDLYAFGCLLHWMLVGEPPFVGRNFTEVLLKQLSEPATAPSRQLTFLPAELDHVVLKLLEKAPVDRYSAASDVASELRNIMTALQGKGQVHTTTASEEDSTPAQLLKPPLIGREAEWLALQQALSSFPTEGGKLMLLSGAAGMGLSRLLQEVRTETKVKNYMLMSFEHHQGVNVPYAGLKEGLARLRKSRPQEFAQAGEGLEAPLSLLMPEVFSQINAELPADVVQLRMYDAVDQLLGRMSQLWPLVLLVDDLQFADEATIGLMSYLARGESIKHVLIVASFHDEAASLTSLAKLEAERYQLKSLADDVMQDLIAAFLGGEVDPSLDKHVRERAAGNPFFAEEILSSLLMSNQLKRRSGVWEWGRDASIVPPSIEEVFTARLTRLSERTQKTAGVASTIGLTFGFELLQDLLDSNEDDLLDDLDELLRAGLIEETRIDTYRFTHPLLRETLHEHLHPRRRRRYHQQLADTLRSRLEVLPELLADHYAETANPQLAAPYAIEAARAAEKVFANDVAERYFRLALSVLLKDAPERSVVMLELGKILDRVGRWEEAVELYQGAESDENLRTRALHRLGVLFQKRGDLEKSEAYLRQSLEMSDIRVRVYGDLGRTLTLKGKLDEAEAILMRGLELAESLHVSERNFIIAKAQIELGELEYHRGKWESALTWLRLADQLVHSEEDLLQRAKINNLIGGVEYQRGNLVSAKRYFTDARKAFEEAGDLERALSALQNIGLIMAGLGHREETLAILDEVRHTAQRFGAKRNVAIASTNQGEELLKQGRFKKALILFQESRDLFKELGLVHYEVYAHFGIALANARDEHFQMARKAIRGAQQLLHASPQAFFEAVLVLRAGEVELRDGEVKKAIHFLDEAIERLFALESKQELLEALLLRIELALGVGDQAAFQENVKLAENLIQEFHDPIWGTQLAYLQAVIAKNQTQQLAIEQDLRAQKQEHFKDLVVRTLAAGQKLS